METLGGNFSLDLQDGSVCEKTRTRKQDSGIRSQETGKTVASCALQVAGSKATALQPEMKRQKAMASGLAGPRFF
jgi:hypothetical protein